jgi:hypothetical protein
MGWYRTRWARKPWLDALAHRAFDLVVTAIVLYGVIYLVVVVIYDPTDVTSRGRAKLAWLGIIMLVTLAYLLLRLIFHPIRAARTGRFLDEIAALKARDDAAARERVASMPPRPAVDPRTQYRGIDPVDSGLELTQRVRNVGVFAAFHNLRLPDAAAEPGSDESFHAAALSELAQVMNSGTMTPKQAKVVRYIDSVYKHSDWRGRFGAPPRDA